MNEMAGTSGLSRRRFLGGAAGLGATTAGVAAGFGPVPASARAIDAFRPRESGGRIAHDGFDKLLAARVRRDAENYNTVDYRGLKARDGNALKAYIAALETARPSTLSRNEAHAYWINLYNAVTLDVVTERYPVSSIKKIDLGGGGLFGSGPWSRKLLTVEGVALSLDDIEHRIVRPLFADPMSHYGLNCASYSCPNLMTRAFTGGNVDAMLAANARDYVNHRRGVRVVRGRITASKIYSWYADDFGGRAGLKAHWSAFAEEDHRAAIAVASLGRFVYDWSLNDTV